MKIKKILLSLLLILSVSSLMAQEPQVAEEGRAAETEGAIDAGAVIVGHVADAHSWHMFDFEANGKEHSVAIPLPIILFNEGHLDMFWSSRFEHGHADYKGYRLTGGHGEKEVIICVDEAGNPTGVTPIDISITKTSAGLIIAVVLLIVLLMIARNGYKKRGVHAPKGVQSLVELLVVFVRDEIAKPMIGEKKYERYLPYLLTVFFFIFFCNLLGLIPFFPAGANVTGNIAVTGTLALITFVITQFSGNKHYWTDIFNPPTVPWWLKVFPLVPLVEFVGVFTKPIVLMIRLFANMTAGHVISLGFVSIIFILSNTFSTAVGGVVTPVSIFFQVFMGALDCLVSYIQAFVFTTLTALYFGLAVAEPEHDAA